MATHKERRAFERYSDRFDLVYAPLDSSNFSNAIASNFSMGGMYIISRCPLSKGSRICLKTLNYCAIFEANVLRQEITEDSTGLYYGHGIQFSEPITIV